MACLVAACGSPDADIDIVYDPCAPLVVVPASDASAAELLSIDAAIALWNNAAGSVMSRSGTASIDDFAATKHTLDELPQQVNMVFEEASLAFLGIYRDEKGDVVINRRIDKDYERTITIAHELGHAFGLHHVSKDERRSVMNENNRELEPTAQDVEALRANWGACAP